MNLSKFNLIWCFQEMKIFDSPGSVFQSLTENSSLEVFLYMRNHLDGDKHFRDLVFYENGAGKFQVSVIASLLGFKAVVGIEIQESFCKALFNRFCVLDLHPLVVINGDSCNMGPYHGII